MQPRKTPPGRERTPDLAQDPQGDEHIDIDKALEETSEEDENDYDEEEEDDTALEGEEDERDEDIPLSRDAGKPDETKDITV